MTPFPSRTPWWRSFEATVQKIGVEAAGPAAADVDRQSRFPQEALEACRKARLLGAFVPTELGGLGCDLADLAAICATLGQHCSAAGMVMAMHQIQVACLVRHAIHSPLIRAYLTELAERQLLIASVTSELGVGGDMRSSVSAVEPDSEGFALKKEATTISYGEHADDLLVTTRRASDAASSDQVLVLLRRGGFTLERRGVWDTMGMRGTCSPGFLMQGRGVAEQVLEVPFPEIASQTMVPVSHLLWGSLWVGIASDAVNKARTFVREQARKTPGVVPPTAGRLAELWSAFQVMRSGVREALTHYQQMLSAPDGTSQIASLGFALKMNNLKIAASQQVVQLVHQALMICGIAAYKNDSRFSLGRQLRDSHSAALMVGNDRIYATNASLLLVYKDE